MDLEQNSLTLDLNKANNYVKQIGKHLCWWELTICIVIHNEELGDF